MLRSLTPRVHGGVPYEVPIVARLTALPLAPRDSSNSNQPYGFPCLIVGRSIQNSDIALMPEVTTLNPYYILSRRQCLFMSDGERVIVYDCGSTNGTYVNNVNIGNINGYILAHNDVISFGGAEKLDTNQGRIQNPYCYSFESFDAPDRLPARGVRVTGLLLTQPSLLPVAVPTAGQRRTRDEFERADAADAAIAGDAARLFTNALAADVVAPQPRRTPGPVPSLAPLAEDTFQCLADRIVDVSCCSICSETVVAPHSVSCGHTFCGECISRWYVTKETVKTDSTTCPVCRSTISAPVYCRPLDDIVRLTTPANQRVEYEQRQESWRKYQPELLQFKEKHTARVVNNANDGHQQARQIAEWLWQTERRQIAMQPPPPPAPLAASARALLRFVDSAVGTARATGQTVGWLAETVPARMLRTICHCCYDEIAVHAIVLRQTIDPPVNAVGVNSQTHLFHLECAPTSFRGATVAGLGILRSEDVARVMVANTML